MKLTNLIRTLVTLRDKDGKIVKRVTLKKSLKQVVEKLGIEVSTDTGDQITIEEEGKNYDR